MGEYVDIHGMSKLIRASDLNPSNRRIARNNADADILESQGYRVERGKHENGAYFAIIGDHPQHEIEVGRIFAENGFAFTLDKEGNAKITISGQVYKLPSPDGRVEGFTHEIYALNGEPNAGRVADAIKHSHKPFRRDRRQDVQSEIAITISPIGSRYNRTHIRDGVNEYKRQKREGETNANPLLYLHVNEASRKIYRWNI